jgi:hypothetical protein
LRSPCVPPVAFWRKSVPFAPTSTSGVSAAAKVIFSPESVSEADADGFRTILPTVTAEATLTA